MQPQNTELEKKIQAATFACTDEKKSILHGALLHTW